MVLGNGRSGKTSLLAALARCRFDPNIKSTLGVDADAYKKALRPGMRRRMRSGELEISFWDFAGQLEFDLHALDSFCCHAFDIRWRDVRGGGVRW
jgi:GTPase SAR1 family protein